jgi:hypothetical protein
MHWQNAKRKKQLKISRLFETTENYDTTADTLYAVGVGGQSQRPRYK